MRDAPPILSVRDLAVSIGRRDPAVPVLADISFDLRRGETLGILGESGSGKSLLALSLIGLLPGTARLSGSILFDGADLAAMKESQRCALRGRRIAMVFQEPMSALNPAMRVGDQIAEGLRLDGASRTEARRRAVELLDRVRMADAANRADAFPHELSGGQRQRVVIAISLARSPDILIADEPTTALDATTQRDILALLADLARERSMALILISHDVTVIAQNAARLLVLYAGTRFEEGPTAEVMADPANPYTRALLQAVPRRREGYAFRATPRLAAIPGTVPQLSALPPGCRFAPRCASRIPDCEAGEPVWRTIAPDRAVRCLRARERRREGLTENLDRVSPSDG